VPPPPADYHVEIIGGFVGYGFCWSRFAGSLLPGRAVIAGPFTAD
jgi:hypothetical protein